MECKWFIATLLFGVLLVGCADNEPPKEDWVSIVETGENADFRGVNLGDDIKKVMSYEEPNIVYTMPDELTCRIPLSIKDSTFYEITYNFNDDGLYVISLVVFPKDTSDCTLLYNHFKNYYDTRFGRSSESNRYTAWYTHSADGTDVEITMIDESAEKKKPFLSITYFEEDGIAP